MAICVILKKFNVNNKGGMKMEKNIYSKPEADIVSFNGCDIIRTSGAGNKWPGGKPGNGFGDKNHNHSGPPGQM